MDALQRCSLPAPGSIAASSNRPDDRPYTHPPSPPLSTTCVLIRHLSYPYAYCIHDGRLWTRLLPGVGNMNDPWRALALPALICQLALLRHRGDDYLLYLEESGRVALLVTARDAPLHYGPRVTSQWLAGQRGPVARLHYSDVREASMGVTALTEAGTVIYLSWSDETAALGLLREEALPAIAEPVHTVTMYRHRFTTIAAVGRSGNIYYIHRDGGACWLDTVRALSPLACTGLSYGTAYDDGALWYRATGGEWMRPVEGALAVVPAHSRVLQTATATFFVSPAGQLFTYDGCQVRAVKWAWQGDEHAWTLEYGCLPHQHPCTDGRFAITDLTLRQPLVHYHNGKRCRTDQYHLILWTSCQYLVGVGVCPVTGHGEIWQVTSPPGTDG